MTSELGSEFLSLARKNDYPDGTTSLLATVVNNRLSVANLGDSVALLVRNGQMIELTREQTPDRIDEY